MNSVQVLRLINSQMRRNGGICGSCFMNNYCGPNKAQRPRCFSSKSKETELLKNLQNIIKATGPLTVAAYMQEVLTNPLSGYYMHKDVFGQAGDFITSPEINQMFGELVSVWFINQWIQTGRPDKVQLVELGPGRGTLVSDMIRVLTQFKLEQHFSIHLVEVSPKMSEIQEKTLTGKVQHSEQDSACYKTSHTKSGIPVSWYQRIQDVPKGNSFFLAHEFFDVLPVHQFQRTDKGWREVLVDIDDDTGPHHLKFVLSPGPTYPSLTLIPKDAKTDRLEMCPQAGVIMQEMTSIISQHGGAALIVDYGDEGSDRHTLRAFRKHKLTDVFDCPGEADITANVDFAFLKKTTQGKVASYGPVTQSYFLHSMGIQSRLKALLQTASANQANTLMSGYNMLTAPSKMGECFKFLALTRHGDAIPAAFDQTR